MDITRDLIKHSRTFLCTHASGPFRASLRVLGMGALLTAVAGQAQTLQSISLNGGTLSWISTYSVGHCGQYGEYQFGIYNLTNFAYSYTYPSTFNSGENIPVNVNLGGNAGYITGPCVQNGPQPPSGLPLYDATQFYRIWFTAGPNGGGSATMESFSLGGAAPKYLILGVIYAPPGPGNTNPLGSSFVDYSNTTELGTNTTWGSSFQNGYNYSTSAAFRGITIGGGAAWTQETDDSTAISINKSASTSEKYPGTLPATTIGLNHDNDIVVVWLNPALMCTAEEVWATIPMPAAAQCLIYDPMGLPGDPDDPLMDTVELPVGEINGHYSLQAFNPDTYNILQNHGVTAADYASIVAADPYASCADSIGCVQQTIGVNSTRFDLVSGAGIIPFGNNCTGYQYNATYQATTTQGRKAQNTFTVTNTISGFPSFVGIMKEILTSTQTWTDTWGEATTSMTGQTAVVNINEPCGPHSGPSQFKLYKDNIYGTFMLYPTQ